MLGIFNTNLYHWESAIIRLYPGCCTRVVLPPLTYPYRLNHPAIRRDYIARESIAGESIAVRLFSRKIIYSLVVYYRRHVFEGWDSIAV